MEFKKVIGALMDGAKLSQEEAYELMMCMSEGFFNEGQNAAIIIALSSRDITLEEITGFRKAILSLSINTPLEQYDAIDLCGTGGDGKNTFNISTLSAFVVAGSGYKVAKHGNYGVSSVSGSSTVLEHLGYRFTNDPYKLEQELDKLNICFLHAPLFHPALKHVAGVRKQLGIKTIFNTLGPLVNPARTKKQFAGVYSLKLARLYHYLLQQDGKDYVVVHALDGYDEISLTGPVQYYSSFEERLLSPVDLGMPTITEADLFGGDTAIEAAEIFRLILQGRGTDAQNQVVAANAGAAIHCFEKDKSLVDCAAIAMESITSGKALQLYSELIKIQ